MGVRIRKSLKILPGIKINLSKSGVSTTIGSKGISINVGKKGSYLNADLPGTGIFLREKIGDGFTNKKHSQNKDSDP